MPRKPKIPAAISAYMRDLNARRSTRAGGRPRSAGPRCRCKVMTLKRAQARGKSSDHDPSCDWYRERAIIV